MKVPAVLVRNEWLKTRKRPVFYVTLGLFLFIDVFGFGYNLREALQSGDGSFALPGQWAQILGESANLPIIFCGVVVLLVVANEFSWRTARQNVIDGLSRSEWFWGKAIAAALIALVFGTVHVGVGGGLALIGTPADAGPLLRAVDAAALAGFALAVLGSAATALLVATLVRSPGAAMAVWFFYTVAAEDLLRLGIGKIWESARPGLAYAPVQTFDRVHDYLMYAPQALAEATARAVEAGRPPPQVGEPVAVVTAAIAWIVGLTVAGWLIFRRRDL
jgi:ABC-type transport system involved in multi-copper enzyme maturation permease subunit